jgi:hypothetical protein
MTAWTIDNGKPVTDEMLDGHWGFIYVIMNKVTGRRYVGKKFFTKAGYRTVKGKRKKIRLASDWQDYYGSNKVLLEDVATLGVENFERYIIRLCKSKSECTYWETHYIFQFEALLSDRWYNEWCSCKVMKRNLVQKV